MYGEDRVPIKITCSICRQPQTIEVDLDDVDRRKYQGIAVQQAFRTRDGRPYLNAAERELFITATCGACWTEMFGMTPDHESAA